MKLKAGRRKKRQKRGQHEWKPQVGHLVLCRCQPVSEAAKGVTNKFTRPIEGPWRITKLIPPSSYEISSLNGRVRGVFYERALKLYQKVWNELHSHTLLLKYLRRVWCEKEGDWTVNVYWWNEWQHERSPLLSFVYVAINFEQNEFTVVEL